MAGDMLLSRHAGLWHGEMWPQFLLLKYLLLVDSLIMTTAILPCRFGSPEPCLINQSCFPIEDERRDLQFN